LQCVAVCFSVLQCVAVCSSVLQRVAEVEADECHAQNSESRGVPQQFTVAVCCIKKFSSLM